ncbi:MAG TPA: 3-deoxy-7-phosphoheptulonate synthase, partial [Thermomicrobiales bacterium]|nr:3-deoxy-7-phosphoheptulonate synthase [Thermomicrobiales bacterium]
QEGTEAAMLISLAQNAPESTRARLLAAARERGLNAQVMPDELGGLVMGIGGQLGSDVSELPGVTRVQTIHKPYMMASLDARASSTVTVGDVMIGNGNQVVMAGPCSVESEESQIEIAIAAKAAGAHILRGGAFKPRTSPYSFQGLGEEGLKHLAKAREITGMPIVTEVMDSEQVDLVAEYSDMLQIGSRNMANFSLLKRAGAAGRPILLKRGFSATIDEFLMSAEYLMAAGCHQVVLCERGIRTFDTTFRFNLDLNAVPGLKELTHLPVIVDPCHGTGRRSMVKPMSLAGLAAGADGLMVEVHPDPDNALSDGYQTITPAELAKINRLGRAMLATLREAELEEDDLAAVATEMAIVA